MPSSRLSRLGRFALPTVFSLLIGGVSASSLAATAPNAISSAQTVMDAMAKANAAVVGVRVKAVEGARSALTLGLHQ